MNENVRKRNAVLAQTVIKGLESRNMTGYYAKNKEEALKQALEIIGEGSTVAMGGCQSANEIGLIQALNEGNYHYIDRAKMEPRESLLAAYDADVFLSSANAMTNDGIIVNIDGNSNRVSCIAQGPHKVIFIVGMNKVCSDHTLLLTDISENTLNQLSSHISRIKRDLSLYDRCNIIHKRNRRVPHQRIQNTLDLISGYFI